LWKIIYKIKFLYYIIKGVLVFICYMLCRPILPSLGGIAMLTLLDVCVKQCAHWCSSSTAQALEALAQQQPASVA
jgi:hypothetical protein